MSIFSEIKKAFNGISGALTQFGVDEILETIGEKTGLLSITRDGEGKVLKRRWFGLGPEDEMLVLLAWYESFVSEGLIKEDGSSPAKDSDFLNLDAALDSLSYLEKIKIKSIIGMREKEVYSKINEITTKEKKKGAPEKETKLIEKISQMKNVDGSKVLKLLLTIYKIGKKNGGIAGGKKAVIDFLKGTVFIPFEEVLKEAGEKIGSTVEKIIISRGEDPNDVLANCRTKLNAKRAELAARRLAKQIRRS